MRWKDGIALFLFLAGFIASYLAEFYCKPDSEKCPIDWSPLYGSNPLNYNPFPGHCAKGLTKDTGLGAPMLSVSSLLLAIPIVYIRWTGPLYTPIASMFIGIASFLFHAAITRETSIIDYIGLNMLTPAILADLFRWNHFKRAGFITFLSVLTATILVRLLNKDTFPATNNSLITYTYVIQSVLAVAILVTEYKFAYTRPWSGGLFLIGGAVTLIVANNNDNFWGCIDTQFAEPHFWGHFLVAVGLTLFARSMEHDNGYTKI